MIWMYPVFPVEREHTDQDNNIASKSGFEHWKIKHNFGCTKGKEKEEAMFVTRILSDGGKNLAANPSLWSAGAGSRFPRPVLEPVGLRRKNTRFSRETRSGSRTLPKSGFEKPHSKIPADPRVVG